MGLLNLLKKREQLLAIDIGANSIKLLELNLRGERPQLVNIGSIDVDGDIFSNHVITNPSKVADLITQLMEANEISREIKVITAVPGPSVFTKRIKIAKMDPKELAINIQFEAGNLIPHNISAVKLDYHILSESGKNQIDVLVVAVKNEIIDSFVDVFSCAGLQTAVVDVDYFAMQNVFELNYPEAVSKTVALINVGQRYSAINICRHGESLFTGDLSIGGKLFSDNLEEVFGISASEAENIKKSKEGDKLAEAAKDILHKHVEQVSSDFNRQLSFFWNATGSDGGIDEIYLSGGGALTEGLIEELQDKTGISCQLLDPFRTMEIPESFDDAYLKEASPFSAVVAGLACRQIGDKVVPDYL